MTRSTDPAERIREWADCLAEADPRGIDAARAALAESDLSYLLVDICGRYDLLHPWLLERCDEVQAAPNGRIDLWAREHYKDMADDTPMLTANRGWTTHGELAVGDRVFSPSGRAVEVLALSRRYSDAKCYRVTFHDGAQLVAGAGHLWRLRRKIKRRVARSDRRRVEWRDEIVTTAALGATCREDVGVAAPIEYAVRQLPLHPYVLGLWLGDGHTASGRITSGDAEVFERILALGYRVSSGSTPITRNVYGIMPTLREIGVLNNKHIPSDFLTASVHQRMELLRGLMDSDGHCNTRGTATFVNILPRLAEQVCELAAGLGLRPRKRFYKTKDGYEFWQVSFQAHRDRNPFWLKRKAERAIVAGSHRETRNVVGVEEIPSVPTRCIQVDGGLYLAGRELVPTHNSTILTFGLTLQDICRDPEVTIGLFAHTRPISKAFLAQIMRELETNKLFPLLWPHIFWQAPRREAPQWSLDGGIIVKRKSNPKEATIEAWGLVDGQPTSKHYRTRVYDDVVTRESVSTPEQVKKTTEAFELSDNLGVAEGGVTRIIGTRYSFADTYGEILARGIAVPRIYPATKSGTIEGHPVLFSPEEWERRKKTQPTQLPAQLLQNPAAGLASTFQPQWLRSYEVRPLLLNVAILVDPSKGSPNRRSDRTAIAVIGSDTAANRFLLDGYRHRMNLEERWRAIKQLYKKWSNAPGIASVMVGYEQYGMQTDIESLNWRMREEKTSIPIVELGTPRDHTRSKIDRVERLVPDFKNGNFFLPMVMSTPLDGMQAWTVEKVDGVLQLKYHDLLGPTRAQRRATDEGRDYLIAGPIKRLDETKRPYDLTRVFLDEFIPFPFATFDDLIDVTSRIYDVEGTAVPPARHFTREQLEPQTFIDS